MSDRLCIRKFLRRAWRRRAALAVLRGAGIAVCGALALMGLGRLGWVPWRAALAAGAATILLGGVLGGWRARRARGRIAHDVERRAPRCRNLLITAAELGASPFPARARSEGAGAADRRHAAGAAPAPAPGGAALVPQVKPEIVRLVESRAAALVRELDAAVLFPLRRVAALPAAGVAVWTVLATVAGALPAVGPGAAGPGDAAVAVSDVAPAIASLEVTVTPPTYTELAARTLVDPVRLEAVVGARLTIAVSAAAERILLSTLEGEQVVERRADGRFEVELIAAADGFLALEPRIGERRGARRLVGLVVIPDAAPRVRIGEPGRDLFLPRSEGEVAIVATARDDLGLASLRFTYTIVSGSGEAFEFTEGELPAAVTRDDALSWSASTVLAPGALGLSLGDLVVYRALARDRRPGAEEVQSDAFVVEIVGESAAISGGFALESDEERDALSQRMVIVKSERLLAQRGTVGAADYAAEARRIAAEQRLVRAEFMFMMGGEVQDEFEEAEQESEVAAGRLELRGRVEMRRAVQLMSRAAAMLTAADLEAALPLENAALEALQAALARSRYILRTMPERESIDLARRLSGEAGAPRGARAAGEAVVDPQIAGLRRILAELAASAGAATSAPLDDDQRRRLNELAEAVLRLDPSSPPLQEIAADLATAAAGEGAAAGGESAGEAAAGGGESAAELLARAVERLSARLNERLPAAPAAPEVDPALAGALSDELAPPLTSGGGR